jgi:GNAT superfamily N-acetyltransferase
VGGGFPIDELVYREAYWQDPIARRAFQKFLIEIHGLDLSAWETAGYWDDRYRPFSYFDDEGRVVSSVCVYSLEMSVHDSGRRAAQISGVGTVPARRREGLNRRLTEIALEWAAPDHDFVFLFADDDAMPFYARCGFLPVAEQIPFVNVRGRAPRVGVRALDLGDPRDRELLRATAAGRTPVSDTLGVLGEKLFMFHALYGLSAVLHHLPELDVIVAFRHEGSRATIFDVVGSCMPAFVELYPYVASARTEQVDFLFVPDKLEVEDLRWRPLEGNNLHGREGFPLRGQPFLFPFTSHA